ncbi:hypothetical protein Tco_0345705 [Tanacetum coccineum]
MGSLQMDDDDDEISNYVDLHMYMLGGGWKWQDLQGLLWVREEVGSDGSNSEVGKRKVEFMGRIRGGSFAKRLMVARDGLGGDGFVVDGGRSSSKSRKDEEDGGVENKSSMGSRLIATDEVRIYEKSHENRQKTGKQGHKNGRVNKSRKPKPEKVKSSSPTPFNQGNSRARLQDGRERLVKSSFSLTHSQAKATRLWKKAQGELGFTLGSLREVTQGAHQGLPAWQSV